MSSASLQRSDEPSLKFSYKAIEQLQVGDRVVSDNPDTDTPEQTAVDPRSWRLVKLYAEEKWPDGTLDTIHVQTLQPPAWLELFDVIVGAQVPPPLDLVEMGLPANLLTTVKSIGPCPTLQPGPGRLVLTTVNHLNNDVWELTAVNAAGRREQLRPTGFHKFYSETRGDWVSTKEIHDNEIIRGRAGPLTIVASQPLPGTSRVYNLTVEGEHVYYVSELGLLAHNTCRKNSPRSHNSFLFVEEDLGIPRSPAQSFARKFQAETVGAIPDVAPALRYHNPNANGADFVKFDGFQRLDNGIVELVDAKTRLVPFSTRYGPYVPNSVIDGLLRKSMAINQNPGFRAVLEFPTSAARQEAQLVLRQLSITNISTRVR